MRPIAFALLLLLAPRAAAQPADCAPPPAIGSIPLWVDAAGRPGVPSGVTGQLGIQLPVAAPGALTCTEPAPPPPRDVLHGAPGDVLHGPPSADLLRGPGRPRVEVQVPLEPRQGNR